MDLAQRVKAARGATGLNQEDFGNLAGISGQSVKLTEGGKRTPKPHEYEAWAEASGFPVAFFYCDDLYAVFGDERSATTIARLVELERKVADLETALDARPTVAEMERIVEAAAQPPAHNQPADAETTRASRRSTQGK